MNAVRRALTHSSSVKPGASCSRWRSSFVTPMEFRMNFVGVSHTLRGSASREAAASLSEHLESVKKLQAHGSCSLTALGHVAGSAHDQPE
jgi:hypothetical protein